jgi:tetratricopeptide (TPR) repeat protein
MKLRTAASLALVSLAMIVSSLDSALAAEEPQAPGAPLPATAPDAAPKAILPDETLAKAIVRLRDTAIGSEPTAVQYMDLIAAGNASPAQVNDFAAYMAKRGMPKVAAGFQEYAVKLDETDPTLWLNLGTIRRTAGSIGPAETAYKKTIALDPGNALAHYNLGSLYDAQKKYDEAIEEYRRALVLDPDLADPRKNPQVVNNENLLAVKLEIYQNQAGSLGLPLLQMQKTPKTPKTPPAVPPKK